MSLEDLSQKVRIFYANVDPNKSQVQMDEVTFNAYSKGEAFVNAQLQAKYGMDLNTFSSAPAHVATATVIMAQPVNPQPQPQYAAYGQGGQGNAVPMMINDNGVQRVVYVQQQPGVAYGGNQTYYDPNRARQQQEQEFCFCLTALLACLICFE